MTIAIRTITPRIERFLRLIMSVDILVPRNEIIIVVGMNPINEAIMNFDSFIFEVPDTNEITSVGKMKNHRPMEAIFVPFFSKILSKCLTFFFEIHCPSISSPYFFAIRNVEIAPRVSPISE